MALDRQFIEKKDFPIGRRGYDPATVDEHLRRLADRVEHQDARLAEADALAAQAAAESRAAPPAPPAESQSLAAAASEHVQTIIAAAETSAAEMRRSAADEASEVRRRAAEEADRTRAAAASEARDHVARVSASVASMGDRIDATERELATVLDALRTGTGRVRADLTRLESQVGTLQGGHDEPPASPLVAARSAPAPAVQPEPAPEPAPEPELEPAREHEPEREYDSEPLAPAVADSFGAGDDADPPRHVPARVDPVVRPAEAQPAPVAPGPPALADSFGGGTSEDEEGARLVALNMALNGTPREETDHYLAEHFTVENLPALLDDVYARVS